MIKQTPCLWVAFTIHLDNGMSIVNDGFYEGSFPITPMMIGMLKGHITGRMAPQLAKLKPVDNQGKIIVGVPTPKVMMVSIQCIAPAEAQEDVVLN